MQPAIPARKQEELCPQCHNVARARTLTRQLPDMLGPLLKRRTDLALHSRALRVVGFGYARVFVVEDQMLS